jgi:HEPN domain-containing protein
MTQQEATTRWRESAKDDVSTADALLVAGKYAHCLFFCHLAIEKMLKAVYTKKFDDVPPIMHHLGKLWRKVEVPFGPASEELLTEISTFNVEARYDIFKQQLYKKASKSYTENYLYISKEIILWLNQYL